MIVTVSREFGAAGLAVADGVAQALGYELLTDQLPRAVAARLGTSPDEVSARATSGATFSERLLGTLGAGTPEVVSATQPKLPGEFDESLRRELERTIRERAERGDVVILGRNAGTVLGRRPDLVRVFLTAGKEWRAGRVVETFGGTRAQALAEIERIDDARRKLARERYRVAWGDARTYDLTLDVGRFGIDGAIALVVAAVRGAAP